MIKAFGAMNCADCHVSGTGVSVIRWNRVKSDGRITNMLKHRPIISLQALQHGFRGFVRLSHAL